jgi:hypothetical protein
MDTIDNIDISDIDLSADFTSEEYKQIRANKYLNENIQMLFDHASRWQTVNAHAKWLTYELTQLLRACESNAIQYQDAGLTAERDSEILTIRHVSKLIKYINNNKR